MKTVCFFMPVCKNAISFLVPGIRITAGNLRYFAAETDCGNELSCGRVFYTIGKLPCGIKRPLVPDRTAAVKYHAVAAARSRRRIPLAGFVLKGGMPYVVNTSIRFVFFL